MPKMADMILMASLRFLVPARFTPVCATGLQFCLCINLLGDFVDCILQIQRLQCSAVTDTTWMTWHNRLKLHTLQDLQLSGPLLVFVRGAQLRNLQYLDHLNRYWVGRGPGTLNSLPPWLFITGGKPRHILSKACNRWLGNNVVTALSAPTCLTPTILWIDRSIDIFEIT